MFIQCQNCQATYKIDERKIPDQDTFVRCSKCSTPIPLNKKKQSDLSRQQPHKLVDCSSCGTRYSIPLDKIGSGTIPVRCGKCGHVFEVSADDEPGDGLYDDESLQTPETDDEVSMDNINIPEENEIEVNELFDEIDEEDDEDNDEAFSTPGELRALDDFEDPDLEEEDIASGSKGPTEAYLESVDLTGQLNDESDGSSELDDIPDSQKDDLFLKRSSVRKPAAAAKQIPADSTKWPDIHDETDSAEVELDDFVALDELDEIPDSDDDDTDDPLELQEMSGKSSSNKSVIIILLIVLAAVLGAAAWFFMLSTPTQTLTPHPIESFNQQTRLKLLEPLKGRFTSNAASSQKIFMLEGQIRNDYPPSTVIKWIEVKGVLFDKNGAIISEATAYAGKTISPKTLESASIAELKAIRDAHANALELELESQQTVPFQILFFDAGDNIQKLQAQISRFSRRQTQ